MANILRKEALGNPTIQGGPCTFLSITGWSIGLAKLSGRPSGQETTAVETYLFIVHDCAINVPSTSDIEGAKKKTVFSQIALESLIIGVCHRQSLYK